MSALTYTPGPWVLMSQAERAENTLTHESVCTLTNTRANDGITCIMAPYTGRHGEKWVDGNTANARLIAAAPTLLAALENLVAWTGLRDGTEADELRPLDEQYPEMQQAMLAIAEATGGAS